VPGDLLGSKHLSLKEALRKKKDPTATADWRSIDQLELVRTSYFTDSPVGLGEQKLSEILAWQGCTLVITVIKIRWTKVRLQGGLPQLGRARQRKQD
jgi:hypothetical protein